MNLMFVAKRTGRAQEKMVLIEREERSSAYSTTVAAVNARRKRNFHPEK